MRCIACAQAPDDFHQGHHGHRVEEMHANEAIGPRSGRRQLGDGDRRGVGCDDHLWPHQGIHLLENFDLEFVVFGGGLDHDVGRLERVVACAGADAGQCVGLVGLCQFFFFDQAFQAGSHRGDTLGGSRIRNIHHHGVDACQCADLRNAISHGASANDANSLNTHVNPFQYVLTQW